MRVVHPRSNDVQPPPVRDADVAQPDAAETNADKPPGDEHIGAGEQVERTTNERKARQEIQEFRARQGPCPNPIEPGVPATPPVAPAERSADVMPPFEPPSLMEMEPTVKPMAEHATEVPEPKRRG